MRIYIICLNNVHFLSRKERVGLVVMTCILDFCRHLVCISMAMCPPATAFSTTKNRHPIGGAESFGGTLEWFVKYLELGGTEYRGQKSKVGTKTVYVYKGKKRKKEKEKKKEGTKLTSNSEYWVQVAKSKSGDDNSTCIQRKKRKKKRKKRGDQI